ncbi:MAG: type IV toxin-antitoxin system AbiEi family antitoxin domain-containing protein [Planctomycetota bacterium]|jgi:predicted transcriptional regulator of viral defense system
MPYRNTQDAWRALVAESQLQGGYVTAKQARAAGFDYSHLAYHVSAGNIERAGRGLYRLPEIPRSEHDQLIRLSLLSRGRADTPRAVVSHASALALHDLSDAMPRKVHLTVPPGWRQHLPRTCVLHRGRLGPKDTEAWTGFRVTTPLRTLLDVAADPRTSAELLERAVEDALERGLVRRSQLVGALDASTDDVARERLAAAIPSSRERRRR